MYFPFSFSQETLQNNNRIITEHLLSSSERKNEDMKAEMQNIVKLKEKKRLIDDLRKQNMELKNQLRILKVITQFIKMKFCFFQL